MRLFRLLRTTRTALKALRRNPMRAALTALGIIIGVAAVILMMEIGKGSSAAIQRTIASMGANILLVQPGTAASGGVSFGSGSVMTLTPDDAEAVSKECPAVRAVAPIVRARTQVIYGNRNWVPFFIFGTTPEYLVVREWTTMAAGAMFTDSDIRNASKVCVLGQTLARELFGGVSPLGKEVRVQNVSFKVIGLLTRKGANMMGMDQDDILLAPWTTVKYRVTGTSAQTANQSASSTSSSSSGTGASSVAVNSLNKLYPGQGSLYPVPSAVQQANTPLPVRFTNVDQILTAARSGAEIFLAVHQITQLLRERHRLRSGEPDDFNIRDMTETSKTMSSASGLMANLLLAVALISLVVGGVGIMNIMLVSVTERTREIGLRMAVGARGRDILRQFLIEAVVMCLAGGAIGIVLGQGFSNLLTIMLSWPTETSISAIVSSVVVSASVGIIFGFYPAWKAARLDPIEALRYE
jgi:ABC-type antimicrobial peptide transport system permease subunit